MHFYLKIISCFRIDTCSNIYLTKNRGVLLLFSDNFYLVNKLRQILTLLYHIYFRKYQLSKLLI